MGMSAYTLAKIQLGELNSVAFFDLFKNNSRSRLDVDPSAQQQQQQQQPQISQPTLANSI
jgi:hypothetical protein